MGRSRHTIPSGNPISHVPRTQARAMKNPQTDQTSIPFAVMNGTGSIEWSRLEMNETTGALNSNAPAD
jgi:hypothetical protein